MDTKLNFIPLFCILFFSTGICSNKNISDSLNSDERRVITAKECMGWLEKAGYRRGDDSLYYDGEWKMSKKGVKNLKKYYKHLYSMSDTLAPESPEALMLSDEIMYNLESKKCSFKKEYELR